jgi:hypothetical protein
MKHFDVRRYALSDCTAIALLAGCGGSQPPIGAPVAMPQTSAIANLADRGESWMLPKTKSEDLQRQRSQAVVVSTKAHRQDSIYFASPDKNSVYIYTYPKGTFVGTLTGFISPNGECIDLAGNVFIVAASNQSDTSSTIYEYAHGSSTPSATLSDPDKAYACAVDPSSGSLAVVGDSVAIFQDASGEPTMYYDSAENPFLRCGYDNHSNLYLTADSSQYGQAMDLVRLSSGSSSFERITVNAKLIFSGLIPSPLWDGKKMTVSSAPEYQPITLYRLRIIGNNATVISSAVLSSQRNSYTGQAWIQGKHVIAVGSGHGVGEDAFQWVAQKGGDSKTLVLKIGGKVGNPYISGVTVSVAQKG